MAEQPITPGAVTAQTNQIAPAIPTANPMSGGGPAPILQPGMTFSEIAQSGLRQFSGWVREEFLPELVGRQGARTYGEMLKNSSTIGAIIFAINSTMRKVEWRVDAADDTPAAIEAADFVDSLKDDMSHTFEDLIVENLTMLPYGYSVHELCYKKRLGRSPGIDPQTGQPFPPSKYDDGKIGWRKIPIRGQDTILKWFFGANGEILGVTQQPWNAPIVSLPIEKMLLFRPNQNKGNPEGLSVLRQAYRSWFLAKRLEEQEAILFERMSGLPVMKVPTQLFDRANGTGQEAALARQSLEAFQKIVTNTRVNEQMGLLIPSDMFPGPNGPSVEPMYSFELVAPQTGRIGAGLDTAIQRYNTNMLTSVLADFISMGHSARGAQNLGETKMDLFYQAVEGFLNSNASVYSRFALPRLWNLNGFDYDVMPEMKPDLAQRTDLDLLSNFVLRLSQAGMPLFPDPDLENMLRDAGGLPDVAEAGSGQLVTDASQADARADTVDNAANIVGANAAAPDPNAGGFAGAAAKAGVTKERALLHAMIKGSINRRVLKLNRPTDVHTHRHTNVSVAKGSRVNRIKRAA